MTTGLDLTNRVVAVTGSTSGIGEAVVRRFAACGAAVVVNSTRSAAAGRSLAEELPNALYWAGTSRIPVLQRRSWVPPRIAGADSTAS